MVVTLFQLKNCTTPINLQRQQASRFSALEVDGQRIGSFDGQKIVSQRLFCLHSTLHHLRLLPPYNGWPYSFGGRIAQHSEFGASTAVVFQCSASWWSSNCLNWRSTHHIANSTGRFDCRLNKLTEYGRLGHNKTTFIVEAFFPSNNNDCQIVTGAVDCWQIVQQIVSRAAQENFSVDQTGVGGIPPPVP